MRARGFRPYSLAFSAVIHSTAAAPSEICEELPAVWMPPSLTGLSWARPSSVLSRMPSSWSTRRVSPVGALSAPSTGASIGRISRLKRPSERAAAAFCWLASARRSTSSRVMPRFSAMRWAASNWLMHWSQG